MGIILDRRSFKQQRTHYAQALFVLENAKLLPTDAAVINVGLELSSIARTVPKDVLFSPAVALDHMLSDKPADIILDRIDILFDPEWHVDVLKLLLSVGRNRRLYVCWPGTIQEHILTYSEPDRPDGQIYNIDDYNDLYLIRK